MLRPCLLGQQVFTGFAIPIIGNLCNSLGKVFIAGQYEKKEDETQNFSESIGSRHTELCD